jgi:hypothetical protein
MAARRASGDDHGGDHEQRSNSHQTKPHRPSSVLDLNYYYNR